MLDTDVCIRVLRGRMPAADLPLIDVCIISAVVAAELWVGVGVGLAPSDQSRKLQAFLDLFEFAEFGAAAARHHGDIRASLAAKGTPIGPLDCLIAAHARSLGAIVLTGNIREYQRVPDLECKSAPFK